MSASQPFRRDLSAEECEGDLRKLYAELERQNTPVPGLKTPVPSPELPVYAAPATPIPGQPLSKYEELCRTPSMKMESADLSVITDFSQAICAINEAARAMEKVDKDHPGQIPDRITRLVRENLGDSAQTMLRELHAMRNGRVQKKYDKRCICSQCHSVFLVPLPADNICDSCRAASVPRSGPY